MPTIVSPYAATDNSLGTTLAQLGDVFFGPKATQAELLRQKSDEQRRINEALPLLGDAINRGDIAGATRLGILGGLTPENVAGYRQFNVVSTTPDVNDPAVTRSMMARPGTAFASTPMGFNRTQDVELEKSRISANRVFDAAMATSDNTPTNVIGPNGQPIVVSRREAIQKGLQPVLSASDAQGVLRMGGFPSGFAGYNPAQLTAAGAAPSGDDVLNATMPNGQTIPVIPTPDGFINAHTKERLTEAPVAVGKLQATGADQLKTTDPIAKNLYETRTATRMATAAIDRLDGLLAQPNADQAIGWLGSGARHLNNLRSQVEASMRALSGGQSADMATEMQANPGIAQGINRAIASRPELVEQARRLGIDSAVLQSQIQDLAYLIAKARDPGGRMSDQDIERAAVTIGSALMDPTAARAVLGDLKNRLVTDQTTREEVMMQTYGNRAPQQTVQPSRSAAPQAPAAPQQPAAPLSGTTSNGVPFKLEP